MARPVSYSVDYFPMDVDFFDDPKIIVIEDKFKAKGIAVTAVLLCMIYRNGYFLHYTDEMPYVIAKRVGCEVDGELVKTVVQELLRVKFFDQAVFEKCHILTSNGIQKRWTRIITDCKRKAVIDPLHVVSGGLNPVISALPPEETTVKRELTTQRKEKKSIVNKNKEDDEEGTSSSAGFEVKKPLEELADKLAQDDAWIEVACMKIKKSKEEVIALITDFRLHCLTIKTGQKTESDFARHFMNWVIKPRNVASGKDPTGRFPNYWNRNVENQLTGPEISAYRQHLHSLGLRPKKNRFGAVIDWVPEEQSKAS